MSFAQSNPLIGLWLSNEEKTIEANIRTGKLSQEKVDRLKNYNVFGSLVLEYREEVFSNYFLKDGPDETNFKKYEIVARDGSNLRLRYYEANENSVGEEYFELGVMLEGDCYRFLFEEFSFIEYFCRYQP
ncbi:MAG: hypothetical protein KTR18_01435 [Acidiferrobacterales bacterium]|nr:hypothetical protein [Acidiferrobacterales bacterium]